MQAPNGVIDVLVEDEAAGRRRRQDTISRYFQGALPRLDCADQRLLRARGAGEPLARLRHARADRLLADTDSMLELRAGFGRGMITALARIEGRPVGVIANNPAHLGGAIDADGRRQGRALPAALRRARPAGRQPRATRPASWWGRRSKRTAQVRHVCRLFVAGAALRVPVFSLVTAQGLRPRRAWPWPRAGFIRRVSSPPGPAANSAAWGWKARCASAIAGNWRRLPTRSAKALFRRLLAQQYEAGSALNMATTLEIDAVIDPAESRAWLSRGLASSVAREPRGAFLRCVVRRRVEPEA